MKTGRRSTVVVGLDGATFDLIEPWLASGKLPNLEALRNTGCWGRLTSCYPPVTRPAWKCFSAGKSPGNIGAFWWRDLDRKTGQIRGTDSRMHAEKDMWEYLSDAGLRVGVIGVPNTYPPKPVNGFLIAGGPHALADGYVFPPSMEEELAKKFRYVLHPRHRISTRGQESDQGVHEICELIGLRFRVGLHYLETEDLDFVTIAVFYLNELQHVYWRRESTLQAWETVDRWLGHLKPDLYNIFIVSDHGMRPVSREFYLGAWLVNHGYLRQRVDRVSQTSESTSTHLRRRLRQLINRVRWVSGRKNRERPATYVTGVRTASSFEQQIDWQRTKAFGLPQGNIYLLEEYGTMCYESLRQELKAHLLAMRDPKTGQSVVRAVHYREDIFAGKYIEDAPDLYIEAADGYHIRQSSNDLSEFGPCRKWRADNALQGAIIACGPDIRTDGASIDARLIDVAPTVLHTMRIAVPDDMDGVVRNDIYRHNSPCARNPVIYQPATRSGEGRTLSPHEEQLVQERLKGLGYID